MKPGVRRHAALQPRGAARLSDGRDREIVGQSLGNGGEIDKGLPKRRCRAFLALGDRLRGVGDGADARGEQAQVRATALIEAALAVNVSAGGGDGHLRIVSVRPVT